MDKNLNLINLFLEKLVAEDGLAQNTVLSYQNDLKLFLRFLRGEKTDFLQVTEVVIDKYLQKIYEDGISASSSSRKISAIKNFYNFLENDQFLQVNPTINVQKPKNITKLPKFLTEKEVFTLLSTIEKDESDFGIRLNCMLEILYASGLRVSELVSLKISAIHKNVDENGELVLKNYLIVTGKGDKERMVPLNGAALRIIEKYLKLRKKLGFLDSKWLFCGNFRIKKDKNNDNLSEIGRKSVIFNDQHLTRQRFHQMLKELAKRTNIDPKRVSPHVIRHSFASHLLNNGADLRILQELLGHSDISTTQIYTHILDSKLTKLVKDFHPLSEG